MLYTKLSKLNNKLLTTALRMQVSSIFLSLMIVPAKHSLAVNAKSRLLNVKDFIDDLLIEGLETDCSWKRQRIVFKIYPTHIIWDGMFFFSLFNFASTAKVISEETYCLFTSGNRTYVTVCIAWLYSNNGEGYQCLLDNTYIYRIVRS